MILLNRSDQAQWEIGVRDHSMLTDREWRAVLIALPPRVRPR